MEKLNIGLICLLSFYFISPNPVLAQYKQPVHRAPAKGEIAVIEPGSYDNPGASYILTNDISSPGSAIFLGKDVTLNLNGYTVSYATGDYQHIPNYSFEEGFTGWDISRAPTARIENTKIHVFVGENILRLSAGEEIISPYINLPVSDRPY